MGFNPERKNGLCYYNPMVDCDDRVACERCGWSDEVRDRRIARIRAALLAEEEKMETIKVEMTNNGKEGANEGKEEIQ